MDILLALGGDPQAVDPLLVQGGDLTEQIHFWLREGPLMGGDPSLHLCMRHQGIRGSTIGRGPLSEGNPSWENTPP